MNEHQTSVLLIEDNPGDADLIRLRLTEADCSVQVNCVDRLSRGIDSMRSHPPAVVLLDLNLPDSHGADTFRSVLEKVPDVPIVILSGQDDEELAIKAVHQGVQDYLVKGDITSKHLERSIRYAMERQALLRSLEMSRKQQLDFKNQFLSHVSHELRTPLACIHQYVTLLLDGLAGDIAPEQRDHLTTVLRSVNQLHAMIRDLLEATRVETGKVKIEQRCISISDLIRQAVAMMRPAAREKQVGLEIGLDSRVRLVYADPDRILEVLINLIDNGVKFTPPDGSVLVKACMVDADPGMVYVSVADTGRGISPEAKPLIFERLYQDPNRVDNNRAGLGLGLYISRELVLLHGGRLWVASEPGLGSTFSFNLPLYSLAQLMAPVVVNQERLRDDLVLVQAELTPLSKSPRGNWTGLCHQCFEILNRCVYLDKDLVLPRMGTAGVDEVFFVVASTDMARVQIMLNRIQEQIESRTELKGTGTLKLSAAPVTLPESMDKPVAEQVQQVADRVTEMVLAALDRNTGASARA
jgi:signal transduction histidine kinase